MRSSKNLIPSTRTPPRVDRASPLAATSFHIRHASAVWLPAAAARPTSLRSTHCAFHWLRKLRPWISGGANTGGGGTNTGAATTVGTSTGASISFAAVSRGPPPPPPRGGAFPLLLALLAGPAQPPHLAGDLQYLRPPGGRLLVGSVRR